MVICSVLQIPRITTTAREITDKYLVFVGKKIFLSPVTASLHFNATAPEPGQCSTINSNADIQIYMHLYNGMNHLF